MIFTPATLAGLVVIDPEPHADERGYFARTFCAREFQTHGLNAHVAQCSVSFNPRAGTLRGLHYQAPPHAETKLVRCVRGAIFDVAVDLRPESPTYCHAFGERLTAENGRALYIPEGFAHGFLTLDDASEVLYQIATFHEPGSARGVRWNDPAFAIRWPATPRVISDRDRTFPDFSP